MKKILLINLVFLILLSLSITTSSQNDCGIITLGENFIDEVRNLYEDLIMKRVTNTILKKDCFSYDLNENKFIFDKEVDGFVYDEIDLQFSNIEKGTELEINNHKGISIFKDNIGLLRTDKESILILEFKDGKLNGELVSNFDDNLLNVNGINLKLNKDNYVEIRNGFPVQKKDTSLIVEGIPIQTNTEISYGLDEKGVFFELPKLEESIKEKYQQTLDNIINLGIEKDKLSEKEIKKIRRYGGEFDIKQGRFYLNRDQENIYCNIDACFVGKIGDITLKGDYKFPGSNLEVHIGEDGSLKINNANFPLSVEGVKEYLKDLEENIEKEPFEKLEAVIRLEKKGFEKEEEVIAEIINNPVKLTIEKGGSSFTIEISGTTPVAPSLINYKPEEEREKKKNLLGRIKEKIWDEPKEAIEEKVVEVIAGDNIRVAAVGRVLSPDLIDGIEEIKNSKLKELKKDYKLKEEQIEDTLKLLKKNKLTDEAFLNDFKELIKEELEKYSGTTQFGDKVIDRGKMIEDISKIETLNEEERNVLIGEEILKDILEFNENEKKLTIGAAYEKGLIDIEQLSDRLKYVFSLEPDEKDIYKTINLKIEGVKLEDEYLITVTNMNKIENGEIYGKSKEVSISLNVYKSLMNLFTG